MLATLCVLAAAAGIGKLPAAPAAADPPALVDYFSMRNERRSVGKLHATLFTFSALLGHRLMFVSHMYFVPLQPLVRGPALLAHEDALANGSMAMHAVRIYEAPATVRTRMLRLAMHFLVGIQPLLARVGLATDVASMRPLHCVHIHMVVQL